MGNLIEICKMEEKFDKWSSWLLSCRYANNERLAAQATLHLSKVRDKVIRRGAIVEGNRVLDIGTGDGLIGLETLKYIGSSGSVCLTDISPAALDICRNRFEKLNYGNADFVVQSADNLDEIPSESIDVVTARAVIMYVKNKQKCFNEFYRVLKPGGRLSIYEPVNRFSSIRNSNFLGLDFSLLPIEIASKLLAPLRYPLDFINDSMINFDQEDIFNSAEVANFQEISIEFNAIRTLNVSRRSWEDFLNSSPNPVDPPMGEILKSIDDIEARNLAINFLKQAWDRPLRPAYTAEVYLKAIKI